MKRRSRSALIVLGVLAVMALCLVGLVWRLVRQERLNRALIAAIKRNDDKSVAVLLNLGADANCRDEPPRKFSFWEMVMQVARGSKHQPSHAPTPLMVALEPRRPGPPENIRPVRALLDHGAQVNQVDEYGRTPLLLAIEGGRNATVRSLLSCGATVQVSTRDSPLPLIEATFNDDIETAIIADLLDCGASVNQQDDDTEDGSGRTALYAAISMWRVDVGSTCRREPTYLRSNTVGLGAGEP
jgi:ankyrin repeat protein